MEEVTVEPDGGAEPTRVQREAPPPANAKLLRGVRLFEQLLRDLPEVVDESYCCVFL